MSASVERGAGLGISGPALATLVTALCLAPATASDTRHLGEDLRLEPVAPGVWRHVSIRDMPDYGAVPANGLLVVGEASAALIDTPWTDEQTARLFEFAERELGVRIAHVVPTHSHGDCMGGLAEAHRRGARSHAFERTAVFAGQAEGPLPQATFAERMVLPLGGIDVELRYLGAGHTRDNIVAWVAQRRLLFGGCLVKRKGGTAGYTDEADLAAWPDTLRGVLAAYPDAEIVVPGHGAPGTTDYLHYTIELIEGL